jgi:pullulanase
MPIFNLYAFKIKQMKKRIVSLNIILLFMFQLSNSQNTMNDQLPTYEGTDLGITYTPEQTTFKLWSPKADAVKLNLYENGYGQNRIESYDMQKANSGTWKLDLEGDYHGKYYTFDVQFKGKFQGETPGIYAKAVGVNGKRGMILDLDRTDPEGWEDDTRPELKNPNDIILYELHMRDLTSHQSAKSSNPGKFIGLVEKGKKLPDGTPVGFDHIIDLGVTHVHLLPSFDYRSVDETQLQKQQFNWGYDPENYNVPEGSYSTDPYNGEVRVREFKQMVQEFHKHGIRVIMDVVYNHTGATESSNFNKEFPRYYYRFNEDGSYSNGSGCNNETASEKPMMRKFIIESCKYWVEEYHVDGFRFDLMGIHDIETMNELSAELKKIDPSLYVYGEGWYASSCAIHDSLLALKNNTIHLTDVAAFSDDIRDAIKGSVFDDADKGFISGEGGNVDGVRFGVVGGTNHKQVNTFAWANKPSQCVNYVSCHDNHTLYDKLKISATNASDDEIRAMQKVALSIILTSQGVPFLHAGTEILRTKGGEHNSYNKPDHVNQINWYWKSQNIDLYNYIKGLIELRKAHPAFRMTSTDMINKHLHFLPTKNDFIVAYHITDNANNDSWREIVVVYNTNKKDFPVNLPEGSWTKVVDKNTVKPKGIKHVGSGEYFVEAQSCSIFYKD